MAMTAFDDAKLYLYRHPFDETDPHTIIIRLVGELADTQRSLQALVEAQNKAARAQKQVEMLITILNDLIHSKTTMTHKRLRDIQRELAKLQ